MKTIHRLLMLSLITAPVGGCDMLLDKDDDFEVSDEDADVERGEDDRDLLEEDDREDDREDDQEDDQEDDTVGEDPGDPGVHAFTIRHGDLPDLDVGEDSGGGSGGDGGSDIDPDSLLVTISNGAATCSDPFAADECGTRWSVSFTLPPELQNPGTYSLWDDLNGHFSVTGEPYPEGDCSWGGGSLEGTIEILEIEDTTVRGEIRDADAFDFDANMSFDAPGCG